MEAHIHRENFDKIFKNSPISYNLILKKSNLFSTIGHMVSAREIGKVGFYQTKVFYIHELILLSRNVISSFPENEQNKKNLSLWKSFLDICVEKELEKKKDL